MRARLLVVVSLFVACSNNASRLDRGADEQGSSQDPWSAPAGGKPDHATRSDKRHKSKPDDAFGGFDLQGMLAKIKASVEQPGPYEAPQKSKDFDDSKPHWGVLKLGGAIVEKEAFSWTGGSGTELRQIVERLRGLAKDDHVKGVVLRIDHLDISVPDVIELRAAMHDLRAANKGLRCHVESASDWTYVALAACDTIGLAPLGEIALTGPAAMPIHVKPLLDKLGLQADFVHVGAYKGAAEPLTRDAPSKEMEETLGAILDHRYATLVATIAQERNLEPATVKVLVDTALFPAEQAKAAKLVDRVEPFEAFRDGIDAPWTKLELEPDHKDALSAALKLARFVGAMPPEKPMGDHVAVVYAIGNIVDGDGKGVLGARGEIASHTLVAALRALAADDSVKAVVLRVDSGGGSAQASELIWNAMGQLRAKKPVIVSMSDVAASGGYYISAGATKIFALEDTLTGSIGVVGGKIVLGGALAKLGVNAFPIGRGKRATLMSPMKPWTADERAAIEATMEQVYKTFVARVAEGRHKRPEDVLPIAQGRVWTGAKAKELGLVDEIGGLDAALAEARKLAKVDAATDLEVFPPTPSLRDVLVTIGQVQAPLGLASAHAELAAIDPQLAVAADHLIELVLSFRTAPVQAIAILPVLR